jgi:hypothetical protein
VQFAFLGDVLPPGNFIEVVTFPDYALDRAEAQITPTYIEIDARYAADPAVQVFEAMPAGTPNTELLQVRTMMPIPVEYLHLILGRSLNPRELWEQLGGAIRRDVRTLELDLLMDWLRAATTKAGALSHVPEVPAASLGDLTTMFAAVPPPIAQAHRWRILQEDFPYLSGATTTVATTANPISDLLHTLREERAADRALDSAQKLIASIPKSPALIFPHTHVLWMRFCLVTMAEQLPDLYHSWAAAPHRERQQTFEAALDARCRLPEAATNLGPLASKELYELVMTGRFFPHIQEVNDLTKGISPFTCGLQRGSRDPASLAATARINSFDLMQSGSAAPSLAEQAYLSSTEVTFPSNIHGAGRQLSNTSIVLDVILGDEHPLAATYREFCRSTWRNIEAYLYALDPATSHPILPLIMRWLHLELGAYFCDLSHDKIAPFPDFRKLEEIITRSAFHLLPPLPPTYHASGTTGLSN